MFKAIQTHTSDLTSHGTTTHTSIRLDGGLTVNVAEQGSKYIYSIHSGNLKRGGQHMVKAGSDNGIRKLDARSMAEAIGLALQEVERLQEELYGAFNEEIRAERDREPSASAEFDFAAAFADPTDSGN